MGGYMKEMRKAMQNNNRYKIKAKVDWASINKIFDNTKRENLMNDIEMYLVNKQNNTTTQKVVEGIVDNASRELYIKSAAIAWMSTPEFQMC